MKAQGRQKLRILIVEDNPINQRVASVYLKMFGYDLSIAENGQIGVDKFRSEEYDLILMDLNMPVMDGYQATKEIRELEQLENRLKRTSIIAITANAFGDDRTKCLENGMDAYISKPYRPAELERTIELLRAS